jgi:hypothetical protein
MMPISQFLGRLARANRAPKSTVSRCQYRLAGYASRDSVDLQSLAGRVVFLRCDPDPVRSSSSYVLVTQSARQSEDLYVVIDR